MRWIICNRLRYFNLTVRATPTGSNLPSPVETDHVYIRLERRRDHARVRHAFHGRRRGDVLQREVRTDNISFVTPNLT